MFSEKLHFLVTLIVRKVWSYSILPWRSTFQIMPPRRANARNVNARNANAAPPISDKEVSNVEFRNAIYMLSQSMTNQNNQVHALMNANGWSTSARVRDVVCINPPEFLLSQTNEDPQSLLDEIKKICEVMQFSGNDRVKLASYQLNDFAYIW